MESHAATVLATVGSAASIGFGLWHFFVPRIWNWYTYIDASATELALAVRAVNVFFSLSLVLFGLINLILACGGRANRYSVVVVLGATCMLWATRVTMQLTHPQGAAWPAVRYGLLAAFAVTLACYAASLVMVALGKSGSWR